MNSLFFAFLCVGLLMPAIGFSINFLKIYVDEYCFRHHLHRPDYKFILFLISCIIAWLVFVGILYKTAYAVGITVIHYFLK